MRSRSSGRNTSSACAISSRSAQAATVTGSTFDAASCGRREKKARISSMPMGGSYQLSAFSFRPCPPRCHSEERSIVTATPRSAASSPVIPRSVASSPVIPRSVATRNLPGTCNGEIPRCARNEKRARSINRRSTPQLSAESCLSDSRRRRLRERLTVLEMRQEVSNLLGVRAVVLGHHDRNLLESDPSDRFLSRAAFPVGARQPAQTLDVAGTRLRKSRQPFREIAGVVGALTRDSVSVEIRESRLGLVQHPINANGIRLTLEVREMPDVLDQRESAFGRLPAGLLRRKTGRRSDQQRGRGFERQEQRFEF